MPNLFLLTSLRFVPVGLLLCSVSVVVDLDANLAAADCELDCNSNGD